MSETPISDDMVERSELLPCRKCGSTKATFWDGRGTQADLYCDDCGQGEAVQVSDLFEQDERPDLNNDTLRYPDHAVERVNQYLTEEWNTRIAALEGSVAVPVDDHIKREIAYDQIILLANELGAVTEKLKAAEKASRKWKKAATAIPRQDRGGDAK